MSDTLYGFNVEAAAERLSVSVRTLQRMRRRGDIRFAKLGSRVVVPASEIDRLLAPVGESVDVLPARPREKVKLFPRVSA